LLIYLLDRHPGRALRFIQVLANDPLLRSRKTEAIADALAHLAQLHTQGLHDNKSWGADPETQKRLFVPAFVHIFNKSLAGRIGVCSQDLLYNLVQLATTEDLKKVFDCLVKHRARIGFDTVLHYAAAFGQAGEVQYALKCLDLLIARHSARAWEAMVERKRLRWTCAVILRKSMSASQDFHQTPVIVAAIVRLGVKMDVLLYNVVMHNAMEAGDYVTAFKVYNSLEDNEIQPDKHTFSIMLHGCTIQDNPAFFQSFAQHCANVAKDIRDPWLAADYLYYLYVRHKGDEHVEHTSALLWQSYAELFSVAPLQSLVGYGTPSLRNASISQNSSVLNSMVLAPPPLALYIMLQTEIRSALAISNTRVYNLYLKFKSIVQGGGDPGLDSLGKNPTIWNAFLLAFCQKQQFANASQLIQDMTDGPAKPNIYSWNIFMQAFFKTGQVQAAERVFEIMRNRAVDPDQFTWGVLLRGFAKAQLVERIGDTVPHLEAERELDPDLLRHFAKVVDRRKLMGVLEDNRLHKEASALEKADREAEEERSRWLEPQFELGDVEAATTRDVSPVQPDANAAAKDEELSATQPSSSVVLRKSTSTPAQPAEPPQMPKDQPRLPRANPLDPEVQYRKLQEQLGLVESPGFGANNHIELEPVEPPSTGLGFKSMIFKKPATVGDGVKPATTRKRARFNLAKPTDRGDLK
jgi:pentatricopeptide repeat protein